MGFLSGIFRSRSSKRPEARATPVADEQRHATRRELLAMSARDTFKRHGIPDQWIAFETLRATTPDGRDVGMHLRMILKEAHPDLLRFLVTLQEAVHERLQRLDPLSGHWYAGASWRFIAAGTTPPPPMPARDYWGRFVAPATPQPEPAKDPSSRALLDRLFSAPPGRHMLHDQDFSPTQPMFGAAESAAKPPLRTHS